MPLSPPLSSSVQSEVGLQALWSLKFPSPELVARPAMRKVYPRSPRSHSRCEGLFPTPHHLCVGKVGYLQNRCSASLLQWLPLPVFWWPFLDGLWVLKVSYGQRMNLSQQHVQWLLSHQSRSGSTDKAGMHGLAQLLSVWLLLTGL